MTIQVFSLDFDGCLSNTRFCHDEKIDILANNEKLFRTLSDYVEQFPNSVLMIGSSRQSILLDYLSQSNNRLFIRCFPFYLQVANILKIKFDPLLLSDLYSELIPGMTFHKSMQLDYPFEQRADYAGNVFLIQKFYREISNYNMDCLLDESKFCLLYAQIHKIAQDYPGKKIIFRFFDDQSKLLNDLRKLFSANLNLIPKHVHLEFHCYNGHEPRLHFDLTGTGIIDLNYQKTINSIMQVICENPQKVSNVIKEYNFTHLPPRQEFSIQNNPEYKKSVQYQCLFNHFLILINKSEELLQREQFTAHAIALNLYKKLNLLLVNCFENKLSVPEFRKNSHLLISTARLELDKHRGWKEFLINLFAAIVMFAGMGYLLGVAVKRDWVLFKFQTDSSIKLDEIDKQIDSFMPQL